MNNSAGKENEMVIVVTLPKYTVHSPDMWFSAQFVDVSLSFKAVKVQKQ